MHKTYGGTGSRGDRRGLLCAAPLITFLLAACGPAAAPTYFVAPTPGLVVPPAVSSTESQIPTTLTATPPAPTELPPSPTPVCSDDLDYLQDLTIPDGSLMSPGQSIDKRWQVLNSGSCNWDQRYSLRLISGDAMGTDGSIPLYPARAGAEAMLQILFTAPREPGTYECQWQAVNPDGTPFGDAFYMQIVVGG